MKIANLDAPVVASKCDWGVATRCLSFSPANGTLTAMNKCQGNVFETFHGGYVLEYISKTMPPPNPGFDEEYARNREEHRKNAGKLWAVHRLELSWRPLWEIVGRKKFEHTQDMWARPNARHRWAVSFPIAESWDIVGRPYAEDVFGRDLVKKVQERNRELRKLSNAHRACLADLRIVERERTPDLDIDDLPDAERRQYEHWFDEDFGNAEGGQGERLQKYRKRFPWFVRKYKEWRAGHGMLRCDLGQCDPSQHPLLRGLNVNPHSLFDVHHKRPLQQGLRDTRREDVMLLCPTCHRITHARMAAREALREH